jgi:hypothetical protein
MGWNHEVCWMSAEVVHPHLESRWFLAAPVSELELLLNASVQRQ